MKRLKILPSVLMLVLCVGVLCMGIYAATPNSNQITGSITINPAGASVSIKAWAETFDGQKSSEITINNLRTGGAKIDFTDTDVFGDILNLDFTSANNINEVKPCYIKIEITNNSSTKELGAYFSREEITKPEAAKSDIFTTEAMTNSASVTATSLDFYKQMGVANAQGNSDSATLVLEFKANAFIENNSPITFDDYFVNIEEYNPNMIGATLTDTTSGFIKIASTISEEGAQSLSTTTTPRTSITSSTGFNALTSPADLWVVIPNGVTTVDTFAFKDCTALTQITLPNTVTALRESAFQGTNLTYATIPALVNVVQTGTFSNVSNLKSVFFHSGSSLNLISDFMFSATKLEIINLPSSIKRVGSQSFQSTPISYINLQNCKEIGTGAFNSCTNLSSIILGDSLESMEYGAFVNCSSLKNFTLPSSVKYIGAEAFEGCHFTSVYSYDGGKYLGNETDKYLYLLPVEDKTITAFNIHSTCKFIADYCFKDCVSLESLTLPDSIKRLGRGFTSGCTNLDYEVYEGCKYLGTASNPHYAIVGLVNISATTTSLHANSIIMADYALDGATQLTSIGTMPTGIKYLPTRAMGDFRKLTSIDLSNIERLGERCFIGSFGFTNITIPSTYEAIYYCTFQRCTALTSIVIPENIKRIDFKAFDGCTKLTEVTILSPEVYEEALTKVYAGGCLLQNATKVIVPKTIVDNYENNYLNSNLWQKTESGNNYEFTLVEQ